MTSHYHVIDFPLRDNLPPISIDFVPFGTRTLKINVTNPKGVKGKLVLRSRNVPKGFGKKLFYSHEKDGANFRVSWGGGQEKGVCLNGEDIKVGGKKIPIRVCQELEGNSYIYLNVTHVQGEENREYTLELSVVDEKDRVNAKPRYSKIITLTPPKQLQDGDVTEPMKLEMDNDSYHFSGKEVLSYVPRWWSPERVEFAEIDESPPEIRLEANGNKMQVKMGPDSKTIATVQDNILFQGVVDKNRYFDAEMYHFTKHFFVLRLWFAWLEKRGLDTALDEIPDAERFDLVIDAKKLRVVYAATDFHWREVWVPVPRPKFGRHIIANLGMFSDRGFNFLSDKVPFLEPTYDGWLKWIEDMIKEQEEREGVTGLPEQPNIPSEVVRLAVEEKLRAGDLGANVEAHVPNFENVDRPEGFNFISSDPTKG